MGIFGIINAYGEAIIPQIGWLYTFPFLAFKNMPSYLIENIPESYFLYEIYVSIIDGINQLFNIAINLPFFGGYIDSILSMTLLQLLLPITIVVLVLLLLLSKIIKLLVDITPI